MVFAEASPTPEMTYGFLAVVLLLATIGDRCFSLVAKLRREPEKREVSFSAEHVSRTDFKRLESEFKEAQTYGQDRRKAIYEKIESANAHTDHKFGELRDCMDEKFEGVQERITTLGDRFSELRGEIKRHFDQKT